MTVEKLITDHIDIWSSALQTRSTAGRGSNGKIDLYGIKKLRELILELAVRGKLVPQDPNDEPASELLKRIAAEKAELVRQGKIKKQKPLPEISEDEKPFELPVGWEWVRLGFITNYGECDKAEPTDADADTWIVELEDIEKSTSRLLNRVTFSERPFKSSKNKFNKNDVLYGKLRPYLDKVLVADDTGVCTTEIIPIKVYGNILPGYLRLLLKSPRFIAYANESTHGMNLPRLGTDKAINAVVELTAIAEQSRIVNKVDELMSLCDQLEQQSLTSLDAHQQLVETLLATLADSQNAEVLAENWARISQHFDTLFTTEVSIDALKQTILQLAVMGKLVPQDPNDEPASELLKRIEQEKAQLVKEGKIKKQKPLPEISEDEKPFELPKGWEWCRIGSVINIRAELVKPENYYDFFQVAPDIIEKGTGKVISKRTVKESGIKGPNSRFYKNQIVYSKIRPSLSKAFIAEYDGLCSADMYPLDCFINTGYLLKVILSEVFLIQVRAAENRIKMPKLNVESLSNILIPVPPAGIQSAVFSKISQMDIFCDTLKSRLQSAQQTQLNLADALTDAALN
ncbi:MULTISPECIES: restriction endonuclease subunit S [Enterobacter cloacae complex]|uniref:restriction endonuclease subunit S n=1 Tax=Enterobacter cloacae complex TaxID=354276 RepID=UPI00287543FE|nr:MULTISPECIES: restriction endonuclease subunit S [Enterobacter cloacae complex]HBN6009687.1 restriction endonuclease subunit S [Enterobacter cloacae]MDR9914864.1 restriction endonuclease subunit S [Enterobacter cloacae subsp. cloacae]WRL99741.1 restriction endonuclease subunit S [Enterobacter hormaechei]HBN6010144.1 restriction endonuclease subunit S [Enterobacter cloacae]HCK7297069.1 restriction endonuclease subunit S [Enterobacter cloacae]